VIERDRNRPAAERFLPSQLAEGVQGRIPLFHKTGIRNSVGQLEDEVVSYTACHALRKRVLHEQ
jgi:hypothetical protein